MAATAAERSDSVGWVKTEMVRSERETSSSPLSLVGTLARALNTASGR